MIFYGSLPAQDILRFSVVCKQSCTGYILHKVNRGNFQPITLTTREAHQLRYAVPAGTATYQQYYHQVIRKRKKILLPITIYFQNSGCCAFSLSFVCLFWLFCFIFLISALCFWFSSSRKEKHLP